MWGDEWSFPRQVGQEMLTVDEYELIRRKHLIDGVGTCVALGHPDIRVFATRSMATSESRHNAASADV